MAATPSTTPSTVNDKDGEQPVKFVEHLDERPAYRCKTCLTELALLDELVSKNFSSRSGSAYLFRSVFNTTQGADETRPLLTGLHITADITCNGCSTVCGWKYVRAFHSSQRYKENKYILEVNQIIKDNKWSETW